MLLLDGVRSPARWLILTTEPAGGAENMALDHALARRAATTGEAVLRFYSWARPTLSLGRNQLAARQYDRAALDQAGWDVVRRPTGGRAVLHWREVTYSAAVPLDVGGAPRAGRPTAREWYLAINEVVVVTLQTLGVPASMVPIDSAAPRHRTADAIGLRACFDDAIPGEIVAGGRKLVGSAQWREGNAILQHGSMLIADDQQLLARVMPSIHPAPVATLREYLATDPSLADFAAAARHALDPVLASLEARPTAPLDLEPETAATAISLESHYTDPAWTWRR